jgi:thiamine biosynthesis protein ThiI
VNTNAILCRYGEIALKGQNRSRFESCLADNLRRLLREIDGLVARRVRGRLWLGKAAGAPFAPWELARVQEQLPKAFGLTSFSPGIRVPPALAEIQAAVVAAMPEVVAPLLAARPDRAPLRFRVRTTRSWKEFPLDSRAVNIALAESLADQPYADRLAVDLDHAELTIGCDLRPEFAFVFFSTQVGPGGLPVGCHPPALALLSGGIDSPVASLLTMRRGCPVDFITFHSAPYTPPETLDKVERIAAFLNAYQPARRLFACNLAPLQVLIRDHCAERFRTVLYRRMMMRIATAIARRNRNGALVTGESLGQVASQTLVNLDTINAATDLLVLRPLLGMDKTEAIDLARRFGTFASSCEPVPDSCTVFSPASPATSARRPVIEREEARSDWAGTHAEIVEQTWATAHHPPQGPQ